MITLKIILWFVFIVAEAYRNYRIIEVNKSRPDYLHSFVVRGMAAIGHGVLFDPHNMADYLPVFILQVSSFWVLFDFALNYMRKKPLLYIGAKSGWIDRFFTWVGSEYILGVVKLLTLVVCILSAVVLYFR